MYWCTCDKSRSQFVDGLSAGVSSTPEILNKTYPECKHISTIKRMIQGSIDGVYDLTPDTEFDGIIIMLCILTISKYNSVIKFTI